MQIIHNDTAILLFSRLPHDEAMVKGYSAALGKRAAVKLARAMLSSALHTARHTGYPVVTSYSNTQQGQTFGERLANSIEQVYSQGYSKVIAMGIDTPTLPALVLKRAAASLDAHNLVLGPSSDGGVYLIAVHKRAYCREMVLNISWGTDSVFQALEEAAAGLGLSLVTEELHDDIDSFQDLLRWQVQHSGHPFSSLLPDLFPILQRVRCDALLDRLPATHDRKTLSFRGPPVQATCS